MNKKATLAIIAFLVLIAISGCAPKKTLPTYFSYTEEELQELNSLKSSKIITADDLYQWDKKAFDLVSANTLTSGFDPNTAKIYAYLAAAQRDAAFLSFNAKQKFAGSVAPVSKEVLCIFFPNDCSKIDAADSDEYSTALARTVVAKVEARIAEDDARLQPYQAKIGAEYWDGFEPRIGIADGSRKPWFLQSGSQFRVSEPPSFDSDEFKNQLAMTKESLQSATDKQKQAVVFWAGGPGTKTPPGIWLDIADNYMQEKNTDVEKALNVRAMLAMTLADAVIAVFDSKYTYWTRRPFMMDNSILTIMPTPNHPSYPAGHSTLSAAAAAILTHYFPESKEKWSALAEEGGLSRIWGGIHYTMDHEQGVILGTNAAQEALKHAQ